MNGKFNLSVVADEIKAVGTISTQCAVLVRLAVDESALERLLIQTWEILGTDRILEILEVPKAEPSK
jgi:hypothetical protein